jgi:ATP-binding cassette subfamily B protein
MAITQEAQPPASATATVAESDHGDVSSTAVVHFLRELALVHLQPFHARALVVLACGMAALAFSIVQPLLISTLVDQAIVPRDARMMWLLGAAGVGLFLFSCAGTVALHHQAALLSALTLSGMRLRMFTQLQKLPASFFARTRSADILATFQNDLMAVESASMYSVVQVAQHLLSLAAALAVAFFLDWRMALILLACIPCMVIAPKLFADRAMKAGFARKRAEIGVQETVAEAVAAQALTRSLGLERRAIGQFSERLADFLPRVRKANFLQLMVFGATALGGFLAQILVILVGGVLVFRGELSVGRYLGFLALLGAVTESLSWLSDAFSEMIPAVPSLKRIGALLARPLEIVDAPDAVPAPPLREGIALAGVSFAYPGSERRLLEDCNVQIGAGRSVALVGRSGCGKSTALALLQRFYEPTQGCVTVDGIDLRNITLASWREQTAVVFQESFLFDTTVRANIRLGRPEATDAEVVQAATAAEVHDAILAMPDGYETVVGERGGRLSGGQRQRIAIARALLRQPRVLLLDEPTSALDPATESALQATLQRLRRGLTVVTVTHRLSTVSDYDDIVVMADGRVAEVGSPAELMARDGLYAVMARQQGGFVVSSDGQDAQVTPERLRALPLFAQAPAASLEKLAHLFVAERCLPGDVLVREGDRGDRFFLVVRGAVGVSVRTADGAATELAPLEEGDYFGEIALLDDVPRTATVRALRPTLLLSLQRRHFELLLQEVEGLRPAIRLAASNRLANSSRLTEQGSPWPG